MNRKVPYIFLFFSMFVQVYSFAQTGCPDCVVSVPDDLSENVVYLSAVQKTPFTGQNFEEDLSFRLPENILAKLQVAGDPNNGKQLCALPEVRNNPNVPGGIDVCLVGGSVEVQSISILRVEGLPSGFSWQANKDSYAGGEDGCVRVCGITDQAGDYNPIVHVRSTVNNPLNPSQPITTDLELKIQTVRVINSTCLDSTGQDTCSPTPPQPPPVPPVSTSCGETVQGSITGVGPSLVFEGQSDLWTFSTNQNTNENLVSYEWIFDNGDTSRGTPNPPAQRYVSSGRKNVRLSINRKNIVLDGIALRVASAQSCWDRGVNDEEGVGADIHFITSGAGEAFGRERLNTNTPSWTDLNVPLDLSKDLLFLPFDNDGTVSVDTLSDRANLLADFTAVGVLNLDIEQAYEDAVIQNNTFTVTRSITCRPTVSYEADFTFKIVEDSTIVEDFCFDITHILNGICTNGDTAGVCPRCLVCKGGNWVVPRQGTSLSKLADEIEWFDVYPNPNSGSFSISLQSKKAIDVEVSILSLLGEVLYTESISNMLRYNHRFDDDFPKGVHILKISSKRGDELTRKVVVY